MSSTSTLAVIVGSVREGRFGPVVADWFVGQAKQRDDLGVDLIDLTDTPIPSTNLDHSWGLQGGLSVLVC